MKYKVGDKVFASYSALGLWHNPYSFKDGFKNVIRTVKTASEERFSDSECDLYYPSISDYVYHQGTGTTWESKERMYHLEHDKQLIHDELTASYNKELNKAKEAKEKEIQRVKDWIERYQSQLDNLLENDTDQQKLIKERYLQLRDTLFPI
jgi:hypothetical protein